MRNLFLTACAAVFVVTLANAAAVKPRSVPIDNTDLGLTAAGKAGH